MKNIQRNINVEKQIEETMILKLYNITFVLIIQKKREMFMSLFEGASSFVQISNTIKILHKT
jgi:hypothetical protein